MADGGDGGKYLARGSMNDNFTSSLLEEVDNCHGCQPERKAQNCIAETTKGKEGDNKVYI